MGRRYQRRGRPGRRCGRSAPDPRAPRRHALPLPCRRACDQPAPVTAAGDLIGGRYRLERPIGSGGMATVWRAVDDDTGAVVAVKLMHPRVQDDPDLLVRFRREAHVVARLDHPCIVRMLDQDAGADDGPYIVFELVD
ncbi:MAG: hypothetical protein FJW92_04540, partial [Actinobacteria bacterium]|nr:hypothetical protein [Actinomycetota bacterium]